MNKLTKNDFFYILIMCSIITFALSLIYGLNFNTLKFPISYSGGDDFTSYGNAKVILESGWTIHNELVGAPFSANMLDFPPFFLDNYGTCITKFFGLFTDNAFLALNLRYLSVPFISSILCYYVLIFSGMRRLLSVPLSISFVFLPYYFYRGIFHIVLTDYSFVVLSIFLCLYLYKHKEDNGWKINRSITLLVVLYCFLIANNGIGYYPAFSCFFLAVTALIVYFEKKEIKSIVPYLCTIICICVFFASNFIPAFIYNLENGKNPTAVNRLPIEQEIYGLKISQLILPNTIYGSDRLTNRIKSYKISAPLQNENAASYLGLVPSMGFIFLILSLFKVSKDPIINLLSKLNIAAVLLATIGGFSTIFSVFITSMLRGYNRISVFIGFISILALGILLNNAIDKIKHKKLATACISLLIICIVAIQLPRGNNFVWAKLASSDADFIHSIEQSVPENSCIYQLPYKKFPETGPINKMNDYHLLTGFLHSKTLKWSYGAVKGRPADLWNEWVSNLPLSQRLKVLSIVSFEGVYVDWRAYSLKDREMLDKQLRDYLHVIPLNSNDEGNLSFYNMNKYNAAYRNKYSHEELQELRDKLLNIRFVGTSGVYGTEKRDGGTFNWVQNKGSFSINSYEDSSIVTLTIKAMAPTGPCNFIVDCSGKKHKFELGPEIRELKIPLKVSKGMNIIKFSTDAKRVHAPADSREMYIQFIDFDKNSIVNNNSILKLLK